MSSDSTPLSHSGIVIPSHDDVIGLSDSPAPSSLYGASKEADLDPPTACGTTLVVYKEPTLWRYVRGGLINLFLPFVNGMMLGFGELFAHEAAFRLGWGGTKVFPVTRRRVNPL